MSRISDQKFTTWYYGKRWNRSNPASYGAKDTRYMKTRLSSQLERAISRGTRRVNGRWYLPTGYFSSYYERSYVAWEQRNAFWTEYDSSPIHVYSSDLFFWIPVGSLSNLKNKAITNMSQTEVSGGVFVGEAEESFTMITKRAKQVLGAVKAARHLDFRGVAKSLGVAALPRPKKNNLPRSAKANSLFLEYQFGWLPMLSDVYNAVHAINNIESGSRIIQTNVASDGTSMRKRRSGAIPFSYVTKDGRVERKVSLTFERISAIKDLKSVFGIDDPLNTAYDLTAMSFVLDWFIPIGDFLGALHQTGKVNFLHGFVSTYEETKIKPGNVMPGYHLVGTPVPSKVTRFERTPINNGVAEIPSFRLPKSADQAISAVSLLLQRI